MIDARVLLVPAVVVSVVLAPVAAGVGPTTLVSSNGTDQPVASGQATTSGTGVDGAVTPTVSGRRRLAASVATDGRPTRGGSHRTGPTTSTRIGDRSTGGGADADRDGTRVMAASTGPEPSAKGNRSKPDGDDGTDDLAGEAPPKPAVDLRNLPAGDVSAATGTGGPGITSPNGTALLIVRLRNDTDALYERLSRLATVVDRHGRLVEARVELADVEDLRERRWIRNVRRPASADPSTLLPGRGRVPERTDRVAEDRHVPSVDGDLVGGEPAPAATGEGVRVGVLDCRGFDPEVDAIADQVVATRSFSEGGITGPDEPFHGTGMAGIVAQDAPDADLYLANYDTKGDFADAVDWLSLQGVDVIVSGCVWFAGPYDGSGFVSRTADRAVERGAIWVNAAGNYGNAHWRGEFADDDGDGYLEFSGVDETNELNGGEPLAAGTEVRISLSWDDWPTSDRDYDLYVYDDEGNRIAGSARIQDGDDEPAEWIDVEVPERDVYSVAVRAADAEGTAELELFVLENSPLRYADAESSIPEPAGPGVTRVGAYDEAAERVEPYSSRGPTNDGRVGIAVAETGSRYGTPVGSFFGTSAASAAVGGTAARVASAKPSLDGAGLRDLLESSATDVAEPGVDYATGHGSVDVDFGPTVEVTLGSGDGTEPSRLAVGEPLAFEATLEPGLGGAVPPDTTVEWAFGDGSIATGRRVTHAYDGPGTYEVTASATVDGETGTATRTLTVVAPTDGPRVVRVEPETPGRPLAGIPFENTYEATVAGPVDRVVFAVAGRRSVDRDGSDGWTTTIDVGSLPGDTRMRVTAIDADGDRDTRAVSIEVVELADWLAWLAERADVTVEDGVVSVSVEVPDPPVDLEMTASGVPVLEEYPHEFELWSEAGVRYDVAESTATVAGDGHLGLTVLRRDAEGTLALEGEVDARTWDLVGVLARLGVTVDAYDQTWSLSHEALPVGAEASVAITPRVEVEARFDEAAGTGEGIAFTGGTFRPGTNASGSVTGEVPGASVGGTVDGGVEGAVDAAPPHDPRAEASITAMVTYAILTHDDEIVFGPYAGTVGTSATNPTLRAAGTPDWQVREFEGGVPLAGQAGREDVPNGSRGASLAAAGAGPVDEAGAVSTEGAGAAATESGTLHRLTVDGTADEDPALAAAGGEYVLVWSRHDPSKPDAAGSDVVVGNLTPAVDGRIVGNLTDDDRHDARPAVAAAPDGRWLAAWTRVTAPVAPEGGPADSLRAAELAVAAGNRSTVGTVTLVTDDEGADLDPQVVRLPGADGADDAGREGPRWLVAWTHDADADLATVGDRVVRYVVVAPNGTPGSVRSVPGASRPRLAADSDTGGVELTRYEPADARGNGTLVRTRLGPDGDRASGEPSRTTVSGFVDATVTDDALVWVEGPAADPSVRYLGPAGVERVPVGNLTGVRDPTLLAWGDRDVLAFRARPAGGSSNALYHVVRSGTSDVEGGSTASPGPWTAPRRLVAGPESLTYWQTTAAGTDEGYVTVTAGKNFSADQRNDLFGASRGYAPDLRVDLAVDRPAAPLAPGDLVNVTYVVENVGDLPTDRPTTVVVTDATGTVARRQVPSLPPDGRTSGTVRLRVNRSSSLSARVDPDDAIDEPDESNDRATVTLLRPDLGIEVVDRVRRADRLSLSLRVRDQGPVPAGRAIVEVQTRNRTLATRALRVDGDSRTVTLALPVAVIDAGESAVVSVRPHEDVDAGADVDRPGDRRTVRLLRPDLAVSPAGVTLGRRGCALVADVTVANRGTADANATVDLSVGGGSMNATARARVPAAGGGATTFETVRVVLPRTGTDLATGEFLNASVSSTVPDATPSDGAAIARVPSDLDASGPFPDGLPGGDGRPRDLDCDGLFEDVDGDDRFGFLDVLALLFADWSAINDQPPQRRALDFDGDGRVGFLDVVDLLFRLD
jgi:PKD repeat protein